MKLTEEDRPKWLALLSGAPFFKDFDKKDIEHLLDSGEVNHYCVQQYVIQEQDAGSSFFVILKGSVKILKKGPLHNKQVVGALDDGEIFGEVGLLLHTPRTASVLTVSESYIFKITKNSIDSMNPYTSSLLYRHLATCLAQKLNEATKNIVGITNY